MASLRIIVAVTAMLGTLSSAKELPVNMELKAELYESGLVHEKIMAMKHVSDGSAIEDRRARKFLTAIAQPENMGRDGRPGGVWLA